MTQEVTPLREINSGSMNCPECGKPMMKTINGQDVRTMRYLFICRHCRTQRPGEKVQN